jgi:DNA-binding MarR family transcriptional regulator
MTTANAPQRNEPASQQAERERSSGGQYITEILLETFRLNGRLVEAGDRMTRDLELSTARWQVLSVADREPATVAEIARRMGLRRQSVQRTVNSLRGDGFVELIPNPNHRRAKLVQITERGTVALTKTYERQIQWANEMAIGLSDEDLDRTLKVMAAFRARLEREQP